MKFTLKSKETYEIYVNEQRKIGPFIIDRLYHIWSSSLQKSTSFKALEREKIYNSTIDYL